jgi:predicted aspartyl protease
MYEVWRNLRTITPLSKARALTVLEACQLHNSDSTSETSTQEGDEELLALSYSATEGIQGRKTIRLKKRISNTEVLLLVDSGNSRTFISEQLVQRLGLLVTQVSPVKVRVTDGGQIN